MMLIFFIKTKTSNLFSNENDELIKINDRFKANKLSLNAGKTKRKRN